MAGGRAPLRALGRQRLGAGPGRGALSSSWPTALFVRKLLISETLAAFRWFSLWLSVCGQGGPRGWRATHWSAVPAGPAPGSTRRPGTRVGTETLLNQLSTSEARPGWLPVPRGDYLPVTRGIPAGLTLCRPPETSTFSLARATEDRSRERVRVAGEVRLVGAAVPQG